MKQTDPQFKLRLPAELKARIDQAAADSHRSINAEIVARLAASFEPARESSAVREPVSLYGSYTSSAQLIGTLTEVQEQMAALQAQLRAAHEKEHGQALENSKKE
ncbi:Arc family DNA-binding protein [Azorhizophilus paspali]|uniref:Arc family DNA-binding protein n=1 Tax=Azorhizophilus paspali TaxID=69963 RepID=A0ABV6SMG7_AZOPA